MPGLTYVDAPCSSALNRVEGMPFKWSINPYTGCSHACTYCYARGFYLWADKGTAADFDRRIYVKVNAPEVLRRELDLLRRLAAGAGVEVNVTVAGLDPDLARRLEPGAPPPAARLETVRRLNAAGIPAGVFLAPLLPGLTDGEAALRPVIEAAAAATATQL